MKNMKKILVLLVILAMTVTSIATVALAGSGSYIGTVEAARELLDDVDSAEGKDDAELLEKKLDALALVSASLQLSPIDPTSEGYDALIADYNFWIAKTFYASCVKLDEIKNEDKVAKANYILKIYDKFSKITPVGKDLLVAEEYECALCHREYPLTDFSYILAAKYSCDACEGGGRIVPVAKSAMTYDEAVKMIQTQTLDLAALLVDSFYNKLVTFGGSVTYEELLAAKKALAEIQSKVEKLTDVQPESEIYTGSLAEAEEKLNLVSHDGTYAEIKAGMADVYAYLVATPVNPTSDAYLVFINKYESLSNTLAEKFAAEVESKTTFEEKLMLFGEAYTFLKVTPVAQSLVEKYNELLAVFSAEYEGYKTNVTNAVELPDYISPVATDVADPSKIIEAIDFALANSEAGKIYLETVVFPYIKNHTIDPAAEKYGEMIKKYSLLVDEILAPYIDTIDNAESYADRYAALVELRSYLDTYALSIDAIELYNAKRKALKEEVEFFYEALCNDDTLPSYNDDKVTSQIKEATLNTLLDNIDEAYASYVKAVGESDAALEAKNQALAALKNAEDAHKAASDALLNAGEEEKAGAEALVESTAAALAQAKTASEEAAAKLEAALVAEKVAVESLKAEFSILVSYVSGFVFDTSASYYADFKTKYNQYRERVFAALMRNVNSKADANEKKDALKEVRAYLVKTSCGISAIESYNSVVKELYADNEELMKAESLENIYSTVIADNFKIAFEYKDKAEALKAALESYKNAITNLNDEIKVLENQEEALLEGMEALNAEIKALEEEIANETDEGEKALLQARLETLNTQKQTLKDDIAKAGSDISEKKAALNAAEGNVAKTEAAIKSEFESYLGAYRKLSALNAPGRLDVTESCYVELFEQPFAEADKELAAFIFETVSFAFDNEEMKVAVETAKVFADFLKETNLSESIAKYLEAVDEIDNQLAQMASDFALNVRKIREISTTISVLKSYVDSYTNLTDIAAKADAVAKIYELYVASSKSLEKMYADNAQLLLACEAIFDSFSAEFTEWLGSEGSFEEKYERLVAAKTMLERAIVSQDNVDSYNELLAELKVRDFEKMAEQIAEAAPAIEYSAPEGFSSDFASVNVSDLFVAYKALLAAKFDFADSEYTKLIKAYNDAKATKATEYQTKFAECKTVDAKVERLKVMHTELSENPTSLKFIEIYNSFSDGLFENYNENIVNLVNKIDSNLELINKLLDVAELDDDAFRDDEEKANKLETLLDKLNYIEYSSLSEQVSNYNNASGSGKQTTQSNVFSKIETFLIVYHLNEDFVPADLANALALEAFRDYLKSYESDNNFAKSNENQKKLAVSILAMILEEAECPAIFAKEFNSRYSYTGIKIDAHVPEGVLASATVEEFIKAANDYLSATAYLEKEAKIISFMKLLNTKTLSETKLYPDFNEQYEKMAKEVSVENAKRKEQLGIKAPISDYSLPSIFVNDSESSKPFYTTFDDKGTASGSFITEANGNRYFNVTSSGWSPYFYYDKLTAHDLSKGLVLEFDLMSTATLNFNIRALHPDGDTKKYTSVFNVTNNELDFKFKTHMGGDNAMEPECFDNYQEGSPKITWKPGEWRHVVIIFDIPNNEYEVCIDYQSLGRKPFFFFSEGLSGFNQIRFHPGSADATGSSSVVCMDNVKLYLGSAYRDINLFDGMTDADKFSYFVKILGDETLPAVNRLNAYTEAVLLASAEGIDEEELAIFKAFDYETVSLDCREESITKLESLAEPIMNATVNSGNQDEILGIVESIRKYIANNTLTLDQASRRFVVINAKLQELEKEVNRVENLKSFIDALEKFHRAPSLASLKRHYATAANYYRICELDIEANMKKAASDPLSLAFMDSVREDADVSEKLQNLVVDLKNYYETYTVLRMADRLSYENSEKFLECVKAIELLVPNKNELTSEEYKEVFKKAILDNSDYVSDYMVVLNRILISGEYDAEFEGFEAAKLVYDFANDVFYTALQNGYYEVIKQNLDRYSKTTSYIEKAGICAYIENYIKDNNVDVTTETGSAYVSILKMCQEELEIYMADYAAILNANTEKFIGLVDKMKAYSSYKDLKPLYDEAIQNYYYSMNVDSEEAKTALAEFAVYEEMIFEWELNGKLFVDYAKNLSSAKRTAQKYRALVNCAKYVDKVDAGYEGVADALKVYEKVLNDYNEQTGAVNNEISQAVDAVCAVRTNSVAVAILAIIKSIFSN